MSPVLSSSFPLGKYGYFIDAFLSFFLSTPLHDFWPTEWDLSLISGLGGIGAF